MLVRLEKVQPRLIFAGFVNISKIYPSLIFMVNAKNFKEKAIHSKVYLRLIFVGKVRHFNSSFWSNICELGYTFQLFAII